MDAVIVLACIITAGITFGRARNPGDSVFKIRIIKIQKEIEKRVC
jgi:hypothetical protein